MFPRVILGARSPGFGFRRCFPRTWPDYHSPTFCGPSREGGGSVCAETEQAPPPHPSRSSREPGLPPPASVAFRLEPEAKVRQTLSRNADGSARASSEMTFNFMVLRFTIHASSLSRVPSPPLFLFPTVPAMPWDRSGSRLCLIVSKRVACVHTPTLWPPSSSWPPRRPRHTQAWPGRSHSWVSSSGSGWEPAPQDRGRERLSSHTPAHRQALLPPGTPFALMPLSPALP